MSDRQLYRLVAGKQTGPYSPEKLRPLVGDGRISRLDRFSYDGVEWLAADQIPELMGRSPTASQTAFAIPGAAEPLPQPRPTTPVPCVQSPTSTPSLWLSIAVGIGAALSILVVVSVFLGLKGGAIRVGGGNDVTGRFDTVVKSLDGLDGKTVCVRGTYFPGDLNLQESGLDYTMKFWSSGMKRTVVSGDRQDCLTLIVPEAMASRLMQIVGRLESKQPTMLECACTHSDAGGNERPIGRVTKVKFFKGMPTSPGVNAFLEMNEAGDIEEK